MPYWKLRRELKRLADHLHALMAFVYEPIKQYFYDRNFDENIRVTQGKCCSADKVAIFLVYQKSRFSESIFLTVDHLIHSGFSVLLVSNAAINQEDKQKLTEKCFFVLERPNFGYDFGGYRDAIFFLSRRQLSPSQILFLNDSVWFPISTESSMLKEMQDSPCDYVGTQVFGDFKEGKEFYGSYCFLIKKPLLESQAFSDFWKHYKLSSNKEIVLRRGERKFSRLMLQNTNAATAIFSLSKFEKTISELTDLELIKAVEDLIAFDDFEKRKIDLLSAPKNPTWFANARDLIISQAKSKNYIGSSPIISIKKLNFPMIKKNNEMLYKLARKKIADNFNLPLHSKIHPVIMKELLGKIKSDNPLKSSVKSRLKLLTQRALEAF